MPLLKIVKYPSQILKKKAKPVDKITPEIVKLLDDMAETMYAAPGVGLAAPQVGHSIRCIAVDSGIEQEDGTFRSNLMQFVNPEITSTDGEIEWEEGCLSIPDFTIKVKRALKIHLKALGKNGEKVEIDAEGLLSVAIQHEIDHLDGKLLIDRISQLKRELYVKGLKKKHLSEKEPTYL